MKVLSSLHLCEVSLIRFSSYSNNVDLGPSSTSRRQSSQTEGPPALRSLGFCPSRVTIQRKSGFITPTTCSGELDSLSVRPRISTELLKPMPSPVDVVLTVPYDVNASPSLGSDFWLCTWRLPVCPRARRAAGRVAPYPWARRSGGLASGYRRLRSAGSRAVRALLPRSLIPGRRLDEPGLHRPLHILGDGRCCVHGMETWRW